MYCSLDKIDLATRIEGRHVAVQTDERRRDEIEAELELSVLYAMARVLNARLHLVEGGHAAGTVHYVVSDEPPELMVDGLRAAGATLERRNAAPRPLGRGSAAAVGRLADKCFGAIARQAARRVGTRDLAIALRMLEDQTFANPPTRDDEVGYWSRVLELAALAGELLRAKYPAAGCWVQSDRSLVPFGFQLDAGQTVVFPTNRAQRVIEDGPDESLFKLLLAAEETMTQPQDATTGRLMPSLRAREQVELDEIVWRPVLADDAPTDLPIIVCGIDGENTFGMIRRDVLDRDSDELVAEALANLADEEFDTEVLLADEMVIVVVSGSFYAAEKLLDREFMLTLHGELRAPLLAVATPARGLLLVTADFAEPKHLARFVGLAKLRYDDGGGRAISPTVMLVSNGRVSGYVRESAPNRRADTAPIRAETEPGTRKPGLLRRLLGRK